MQRRRSPEAARYFRKSLTSATPDVAVNGCSGRPRKERREGWITAGHGGWAGLDGKRGRSWSSDYSVHGTAPQDTWFDAFAKCVTRCSNTRGFPTRPVCSPRGVIEIFLAFPRTRFPRARERAPVRPSGRQLPQRVTQVKWHCSVTLDESFWKSALNR